MARFPVLLLLVCALIAMVFASETEVVSNASVETDVDALSEVEAEEPVFLDVEQEVDVDAEVDAEAEVDEELEATAEMSAEEEAEIDAEINAEVDAELDADVEASVDAEMEAEDAEIALLETELYPDRLPAFNPYAGFADPNSPLKQYPLKPTYPQKTAKTAGMKSKYNGPNAPKILPLV